MTTQKQRLVYSVIAALTSLTLSMGFAVYYTTSQNQKWCTTLTILTKTDPRNRPKPTTPSGLVQQKQQIQTWLQLRQLARDFHC